MNNPRQRMLYLSFIAGFIAMINMYPAHIKLSIQSMTTTQGQGGKKVPTVFVKEPFVAIATVTHDSMNQHPVEIDNLQNFATSGVQTSTNISLAHGGLQAVSTHAYHLVPQQEGTFTIGPASTIENNQTISSNSIEVAVIKRPKDFQRQQPEATDDGVSVTATLAAAKSQVVVGQPIPVHFKIVFQGPIAEVSQSHYEFPGFITKKVAEATQHDIVQDNKLTTVVEQPLLLIPTQAGEKTLAPIRVVYTYRSQQSRSLAGRTHHALFNGFFDDIVGARMKQDETYSNDVQIKVNPLPASKKELSGVGVFEVLPLAVDKKVVQQNEPILLSLIIQGSGNIEQVSSPRLTLPAGWKAYDSSSRLKNMKQTADEIKGAKHFEYILQIPQIGEWEIPSQEFSFYNTKTEQTETITIPGTTVTVTSANSATSGPVAGPEQPVQQPPAQPQSTQPRAQSVLQDINFIQEEGSETASSAGLSWWLFLFLLCTPLLLSAPVAIALINKHRESRKKLLDRLSKKITAALDQEKMDEIYPLFKQFISLKYDQPLHTLTHEEVEKLLLQDQIKEEKVLELIDFLNECAHFHFVDKGRTSFDQKAIIKKGKYWIVFLTT